MGEQMTLWEMIYPKFKFNEKPIILLEMFAGIGAQRKALENLGLKIDDKKSKICEWAYNSILAYNTIHIKDFTDYSKGLEKETMLEKIKGISVNYNESLTEKQLKAKPIEWVKKAYNNIVATHNLIDISNVKGKDLEDLPKDQVSILTYSFPCQDLSLAGKREGMNEGTRSGLLWQVERILLERKREHLNMPNILLLENVPEAIGTGNKELFSKWQNQLENLGYSNYVKILNAKDYGIPQNRKRVFMVSILGEYAYSFPHKIKLKCHLKDLLEKNVDEKYYLSQKMIDYITATNDKWTGNNGGAIVNKDIGCTINTAPGQRRCDASNYIADDLPNNIDLRKVISGDNIDNSTCVSKTGYSAESVNRITENITETDKEAPTLTASAMQSFNHRNCILIKESHSGDNAEVVVKDKSLFSETEKKLFTEEGNIRRYIGSGKVDEFKEGQMATTSYPNGYGHGPRVHNESISLNTIDKPCVKYNLRIRKLSPCECLKLMGFTYEDYEAMKQAKLSDSAIYHCAGDSIVVPVLMAIFNQFKDENTHKQIIYDYVNILKGKKYGN